MPNNLAVSYGQSSGYPNPAFFLGNFATDPANTSPGQWWYNTTSMEIKGNINGSVQILAAFASAFSSTTYITNDTTIGGQGITVNYVDLVITNNATLTIAAGSNVNVAGVLDITAGASLVMQGAILNIYNALQNAGTLQSTSSSDSIQAVQVQNTGVMQIDGTLYLPNAGYNHILAGTVSGTGTLNIDGTAITLIGDQLSLSISTVNGSGTYQVQQNGICTINGNIAMSLQNLTGSGLLSISPGYTLTISNNSTFSIATISGGGTLSIGSGYTLTVGSNETYSVSTVSGGGALTIASGYTLTFSGGSLSPTTLTINGTLALSGIYVLTREIPNVSGSLVINSGYTLTVASNITLAYTSVSGAGTLSISSSTLTIGANITFSGITIAGNGTLSISSGVTLTVGTNATVAISNISGAGTLSVPSGSTVTVGWNTTLSIPTVDIAGTLSNTGYNITIPSGTFVWDITGSVTSTSTASTLTVNGTLYWLQANLLPKSASSTFPSFPLTLAGSGIMIAGYNSKSNASHTISFSSTAIAAGSTDGSASASGGGYEYYNLSSIEGSAVGKYCLATYNGSSYYQNALIYIGTANTAYSVSTSHYWSNYYDPSSGTIYAANLSGSAGTITLTGTAYV